MNNKKIAIVGGDMRSARLASMLDQEGILCGVYGLNLCEGVSACINAELSSAISEALAVIGPTPFSNDGLTINAPFSKERININDLISSMKKGQILIAGKVSIEVKEMALSYGVKVADLLDREEMSVMNAIPTAEGAIQIAMEELPMTMHGSDCLVLGYGRIAKILAKMLKGIGANVYVAARKINDRAWIEAMGYQPLKLDEVSRKAPVIDVVFNTIPAVIINEQLLGRFRSDCLLIDLASRPGGIDFDKAKELGLKSVWALSLPGKVAPFSAAKYIFSTVVNILEEGGVE